MSAPCGVPKTRSNGPANGRLLQRREDAAAVVVRPRPVRSGRGSSAPVSRPGESCRNVRSPISAKAGPPRRPGAPAPRRSRWRSCRRCRWRRGWPAPAAPVRGGHLPVEVAHRRWTQPSSSAPAGSAGDQVAGQPGRSAPARRRASRRRAARGRVGPAPRLPATAVGPAHGRRVRPAPGQRRPRRRRSLPRPGRPSAGLGAKTTSGPARSAAQQRRTGRDSVGRPAETITSGRCAASNPGGAEQAAVRRSGVGPRRAPAAARPAPASPPLRPARQRRPRLSRRRQHDHGPRSVDAARAPRPGRGAARGPVHGAPSGRPVERLRPEPAPCARRRRRAAAGRATPGSGAPGRVAATARRRRQQRRARPATASTGSARAGRLGHPDVGGPAHRAAVEPGLVDRLVGAGAAQLRRPVGGEHEQRHPAASASSTAGVQVRRRRPGGGEHRHRAAGRPWPGPAPGRRRSARRCARAAAAGRALGGGQRERHRRGAGARREHRVGDAAAHQLVDQHPGATRWTGSRGAAAATAAEHSARQPPRATVAGSAATSASRSRSGPAGATGSAPSTGSSGVGGHVAGEQRDRGQPAGEGQLRQRGGQRHPGGDADRGLQRGGHHARQAVRLGHLQRGPHAAQRLHLQDDDVGRARGRATAQRVGRPADRLVGGDRDVDPAAQRGELVDGGAGLLDVLQAEPARARRDPAPPVSTSQARWRRPGSRRPGRARRGPPPPGPGRRRRSGPARRP